MTSAEAEIGHVFWRHFLCPPPPSNSIAQCVELVCITNFFRGGLSQSAHNCESSKAYMHSGNIKSNVMVVVLQNLEHDLHRYFTT